MKKRYLLILLTLTLLIAPAAGFAADKKSSVAVLDFESIGTEAYLGKAVAEIMRTSLVNNSRFRVLERAQIAKAISEQKFQKSGLIDDQSAVEIGKVLGADLIIVGSVVKIGNAYTINARLIDVKTGEAKLGKNVTNTDLNLLTAMSNELVDNLFDEGAGPAQVPKAVKEARLPAERKSPASPGEYLNFNRWEILNGEWTNAADGSIIGSNGHIILKEEFPDYVLEVKAEHLSGPKAGVGVGARCSVVPGGQKRFRNNTSINQGYAFNFTFSRTYNVYSGLVGNWHTMNPDWPKYEYKYSDLFDESVNRIRIEAIGRHITIYVNGGMLVRFSDTSHTVGAPLLWVQENSGEKVRFYDLRIIRK